MSVLDTNFDSSFDSAREMPSRATWLDNASANLLNDNSYFSGASRRDTPAWLGNVEFFDSGKQRALASEEAPDGGPVPVPETPPVTETPPVGETPPPEAPHPSETPPAEPVLEAQPEAPAEPVGPRAVAGPRPPGVAYVGESLPGNGPPEHTSSTPVAQSRNDAANKADAHNAQANYQPAGQYAYEGPGPDGRNSDGTYGAGHHQYTPPTRYVDDVTGGMTEQNRPAMEPEEAAPVHTPQKITQAAHDALWAAIQRYKATGETGQTGHTGTPNEGPASVPADPNYQPGPPGSFGGLRRRGG